MNDKRVQIFDKVILQSLRHRFAVLRRLLDPDASKDPFITSGDNADFQAIAPSLADVILEEIYVNKNWRVFKTWYDEDVARFGQKEERASMNRNAEEAEYLAFIREGGFRHF
ncbi:hypothetical protein BT69DRAFT_1315478 [Atractiella rhizophila]|nr:hypothetical protein BT69DRAFT_1315478 [Atractiella rhizophila]